MAPALMSIRIVDTKALSQRGRVVDAMVCLLVIVKNTNGIKARHRRT